MPKNGFCERGAGSDPGLGLGDCGVPEFGAVDGGCSGGARKLGTLADCLILGEGSISVAIVVPLSRMDEEEDAAIPESRLVSSSSLDRA